jgi:hypothetical protein
MNIFIGGRTIFNVEKFGWTACRFPKAGIVTITWDAGWFHVVTKRISSSESVAMTHVLIWTYG